ncbi:MAG TPA: DUF2461 domain-containing protein [Marmoricola sp.]|nr:DUF2461 domain-containing protein [Marmoricola sp.]
MTFAGIPEAALDFYDDLEVDNTKSFWEAHKSVYAQSVKAPIEELMTELAEEFGSAKLFRPYRDVRFAKDKTPYKTHQGAYVPVAPGAGWYFQVSAAGVLVGAGFYDAGADNLARFRAAVAEELTGEVLRGLLESLSADGFEIGGDTLKTAPRGYDVSHPRIDLLRHKSLTLTKRYGFEPFIHTPELLDRVRADWRAARPFVEWVQERLA